MKYIIRDIERAVCLRFNLTPEQMRSDSRIKRISKPRQIAMYMAREHTNASYPQIGRHFRKDHSTVIFARRRIGYLMRDEGCIVRSHVEDVREILNTLTPYRVEVGAAVRDGLPIPDSEQLFMQGTA